MTGTYSAVELVPGKGPSHGRELASAPAVNGRCPDEIQALWVAGKVAICFRYDAPIRRLSQAGLAKRRRTILRTKAARRFPLFADQFVADELAARPAFYAGER